MAIPPVIHALEEAVDRFRRENDDYPARALMHSDDYLDFAIYCQRLKRSLGLSDSLPVRQFTYDGVDVERDPACPAGVLRAISGDALYSVRVEITPPTPSPSPRS